MRVDLKHNPFILMKPTVLKVRLYGDPCLRKHCDLVEEIGVSERLLIHSMLETMYQHKGIGLAAPQVGVNKQIFVLDLGDDNDDQSGPYAIINPKIIKRSKQTHEMSEGCLSIPGVHIKIKRPKKIAVEFTDHENNTVNVELEGLLAKAFQHEFDHLQGRLTVDYANQEEKIKYKKALKKLKSITNEKK